MALHTKRTSAIKLTHTTPIVLDTTSTESGTCHGSAGTDVESDRRIPVDVEGTTYYIALFDTPIG